MYWYQRLFARFVQVCNWFGCLKVRYPIIGCFLLCCMLGLWLLTSFKDLGPTLPWPWPVNNL